MAEFGGSAQVWAASTSTGDSSKVEFSGAMRSVTAVTLNPSTGEFIYTVRGSAKTDTTSTGFTLIAAQATDGSTGAVVQNSSTGVFNFDKAWINVSANDTTGAGVPTWLIASP